MPSYESYVTNSRKCGPGQLQVTRRGTARVKGTRYCTPDRGKKGRGPKKIPTPHKGSLGGPGYAAKSARVRHAELRKHAKKFGYASTISALQSRLNLGHRTMGARALAVFRADKTWVQTHLKPKERNAMAKAKKKKGGSSAGLRKAKAVRGAMALGVAKSTANRLYDEGKLTPTGKPKKGARGIPADMKAALGPPKKKAKKKSTKKKAKKKSTKKKAKKKTTAVARKKAPKKKAPPRAAKKSAKKRSTKKKAKKSSKTYTYRGKSGRPRKGGKSLHASRTKKGSPCYKKGYKKKVSPSVSAAADRMRQGKKGSSGRPVAMQRWCRNFMNLKVPEKDLGEV